MKKCLGIISCLFILASNAAYAHAKDSNVAHIEKRKIKKFIKEEKRLFPPSEDVVDMTPYLLEHQGDLNAALEKFVSDNDKHKIIIYISSIHCPPCPQKYREFTEAAGKSEDGIVFAHLVLDKRIVLKGQGDFRRKYNSDFRLYFPSYLAFEEKGLPLGVRLFSTVDEAIDVVLKKVKVNERKEALFAAIFKPYEKMKISIPGDASPPQTFDKLGDYFDFISKIIDVPINLSPELSEQPFCAGASNTSIAKVFETIMLINKLDYEVKIEIKPKER